MIAATTMNNNVRRLFEAEEKNTGIGGVYLSVGR